MKDIEINITRYPSDCKRIQNILEKNGYRASLEDCEKLWDKHSDSMCAGWIILPDDDEDVYSNIRMYIEN